MVSEERVSWGGAGLERARGGAAREARDTRGPQSFSAPRRQGSAWWITISFPDRAENISPALPPLIAIATFR
jgi:hypothetical protein